MIQQTSEMGVINYKSANISKHHFWGTPGMIRNARFFVGHGFDVGKI